MGGQAPRGGSWHRVMTGRRERPTQVEGLCFEPFGNVTSLGCETPGPRSLFSSHLFLHGTPPSSIVLGVGATVPCLQRGSGVQARAGRGRAGQRAGSRALTGPCKDDRGGHAAPPARPCGSGAGGVAQSAEEAAVAEDEQLQGAVWGPRGCQGRRGRREQAGRQLDGGQGHAVLGGTREFLRDAQGPWDSAGPQGSSMWPPASPPVPPAPLGTSPPPCPPARSAPCLPDAHLDVEG